LSHNTADNFFSHIKLNLALER